MNIQIFGTKKSSDTRKAERWFKERRIKFQYVNLAEKEISKGELRSVAQACGGLQALIDDKAKDSYAVALLQ
ncbi:MAG: ArsC family transcriptional regulator, partial [Atopobiaceae bacterium]|nr:ArsC family transcriptional regulator [Atopobiaceae bacterium]